jgi:hypothetical protein
MKPVFSKTQAGGWQPTEQAQGPFAGLQGGAVAGLLTAEIEQIAQAEGLGQIVGVSISFYRATPFAVVQTRPNRVRLGRRASFIENSLLREDGEVCATLRATLIQHEAIDLPESEPKVAQVNPMVFELRNAMRAPHGKPWFMDTMQARTGPDGTAWFNVQVPIVGGAGYFARALGPADWCHGINRPNRLPLADPNQDLTVNLLRAPQGDWLGVRATTQWAGNGIGVGYGTLCDVFGDVGNVSMSVALVPMPAPTKTTTA